MLRHTIFAIATLFAAAPVYAQHSHDHAGHAPQTVLPTEPGQGAFAAIAEIVALLRANPETDWSAVDIAALRQHLIDMDNLVTHAEVTTEDVPNGARFHVQTTGLGGSAVSRMVPAHAPVLRADTGWESQVLLNGDEVVWTVTSQTDAEVIRALGFFGLMAVGNHHQPHHLGMATGSIVH
ncbi:hypothetical protein [Aliiroseovarius marinus]|uniref:hypothetical protein n=1 Tax=Aliiroseovarius marinus TaxID=2500159 RepID=UPI002494FA10|nr:hypothetical protein [Aliiroseovarius marinus]